MAGVSSQTPAGLNQSPPFVDINLYRNDLALQGAVVREGSDKTGATLAAFGAKAGSAEALELARRANEVPPKLSEKDGDKTVEYDPAYHELMTISMNAGLHCSTWDHLRDDTKSCTGGHVARCAAFYMAAQMEAGHCCPVTMTHAAVAALQSQPDILEVWLPKIISRTYDPAFAPVGEKSSATLGMGMTEIQGGTDVRANITQAVPADAGGLYRINGHKFFCSAPMSDAFVVLAQAPGGLSCFLMPRFRPDGSVNPIDVLRLKDKLGNRSNASSEVEFHDADAWLVGEEGKGIRTILDMVTLTRLDCAVSSAGLMRFALAHAIHHCRHRSVFQKKLIDQPLMERVLADMALQVEAAVTFIFRLVRAYDHPDDERESAYRRLMTPVAKYWMCKTAPVFACEAMECLGGNGYVEDATPLARLYREVPVNAIWEGSGNVMCLDICRVIQREPEAVEFVLEELAASAHGEPRLETRLEAIKALLATPAELEANGRALAGLLGELAAGALVHSNAADNVAACYLQSRLSREQDIQFGSAMLSGDARAITERALPPN